MSRILLKRRRPEDFETYYKWYKLKSNQRLIGCSLPKTKRGILRILEKSLKDKKNYEFSVYDKKSGKLIGTCQIYLKGNKTGGLYIFIGDKNFRGKGYGTEILKHLIKIGFDELNLNKLKASVIEYNKASINLFKNFGFKLAKVKKKSWKYNSAYYDNYIFELSKSDLNKLHLR